MTLFWKEKDMAITYQNEQNLFLLPRPPMLLKKEFQCHDIAKTWQSIINAMEARHIRHVSYQSLDNLKI